MQRYDVELQFIQPSATPSNLRRHALLLLSVILLAALHISGPRPPVFFHIAQFVTPLHPHLLAKPLPYTAPTFPASTVVHHASANDNDREDIPETRTERKGGGLFGGIKQWLDETLAPSEVSLQTFRLLPNESIGGHFYLLPVRLMDSPEVYNFIVDTSLPHSVISPTLLNASDAFQSLAKMEEVLLFGAKGARQVRKDVVVIPTINVAFDDVDLVAEETMFVVQDFFSESQATRLGTNISGIMGLDFLNDFLLEFAFDVDNNRFLLGVRMLLSALRNPNPTIDVIQGIRLACGVSAAQVSFALPENGDWVPKAGAVPVSDMPLPSVVYPRRPPPVDSTSQGVFESMMPIGIYEDSQREAPGQVLAMHAPVLRRPQAQSLSSTAPVSPRPLTKVERSVLDIDKLLGDSEETKKPRPVVPRVTSPVLGIISTGTMFTTLNWKAAVDLGISRNDERLQECPHVQVLDSAGKWQLLPLVSLKVVMHDIPNSLKVQGTPQEKMNKKIAEMKMDPNAKNVTFDEPVIAVIGDTILDEYIARTVGISYVGPAAFIGQDVLNQRSLVMLPDLGLLGFTKFPAKPKSMKKDDPPANGASWLDNVKKLFGGR